MLLRNYQLFPKHPHVVASYLNLVLAYCGKIVQSWTIIARQSERVYLYNQLNHHTHSACNPFDY